MRQVLDQDPPPPRMLNRRIDPDLEKIVLKCLEKDPALRYPSAADLAADLRRYRDGEPIVARSVNLIERLHRELHRSQHDAKLRPWGTGLMVLGLLIFLMHSVTSVLLAGGAEDGPAFWVPRGVFFAACSRSGSGGTGSGPGSSRRTRSSGSCGPSGSGYLLAFASIFWVMRAKGDGHLEMYGAGMALSGLAWFAMGGSIWGGCYVIGLLYMGAAPADGDVPGPLAVGPGGVWAVVGGHPAGRRRPVSAAGPSERRRVSGPMKSPSGRLRGAARQISPRLLNLPLAPVRLTSHSPRHFSFLSGHSPCSTVVPSSITRPSISAAMAALRGTPLVADEPKSEPSKRSPGETLQVAVVGVSGRGMSHVGGFNGNFNCEISTICDVRRSVIGQAMKKVATRTARSRSSSRTSARMLDDKSIDIVSIATPNHWHALAAIWAMQAGKHVYVEKPASHNVLEGPG